MIRDRLQAVLTGAVAIFLFSATAVAGSVSLEINANTDDVAGLVEYDTQALGAVLNMGGGIIFSGNDYTVGNLHVALKDELFAPALTLGLGFKGLAGQAEVSGDDYDVAAIGFLLLGEYDFRQVYINFPLLIYAEFSGAPDPLSFRDTTNYVDFNTGIRAYLVRNAAIVAGYRLMSVSFEDGGLSDKFSDDAFYIGLRLTF